MPLSPDEISRRVAALIANLQAELARIDAKHGEERRAAIDKSGLPVSLAESLLQSRHSFATVEPMSSTTIVADSRPGPIANGPAWDIAHELGYASLREFAKDVGFHYTAVRSWNSRGDIPSKARPAIDKLREKRAKAAAAKRKG